MNKKVCTRVFVRLIAALTFCGVAQTASAQANPDEWQYALTPYLWLPTIDGVLKYSPPPGGGGSPEVEMGPTDWLDLLNMGALVSGSARKGRFSILSDLVYLSLQSKEGRVASVEDTITVPGVPVPIPISASLNANTKTDFDGLAWSIAAGYAVKETERVSMDVFAGVRYFGTDAKTSWNLTADITTPGGTVVLPAQGSVGKDTDLWDGIVGVRGEYDLAAEKWSVPFYLDVGTGDSELTWQAMAALSYEFGWGDFLFFYRHLEYDQDSSGLLQNFSFTGPGFGGRFRF